MSFVKDLKEGQAAEDKFIELLKEEYLFTHFFKPSGKFKFFDIIAVSNKGKVITYEVKKDRRSEETGNVAIELEYNKHCSGVTTSTAKYVVYYLAGEDKFYSIETWKLRKFLWIHEDKKTFKTMNAGDGYKSKIMLIPVEEFKKIFTKL